MLVLNLFYSKTVKLLYYQAVPVSDFIISDAKAETKSKFQLHPI